jgi:hypothetical protein
MVQPEREREVRDRHEPGAYDLVLLCQVGPEIGSEPRDVV